MPKAKPKSLLGGRIYLVYRCPDRENIWIVGKMKKSGGGVDSEYFVDANKVCSCKAADFGNGECKHVLMVNKKLAGTSFSRARATVILEEYMEYIRTQFSGCRVRSLMRYRDTPKVDKATAIGTGLLELDHNAVRLDIWGESKGLLILLQIFKDFSDYRKTFASIQFKASGGKIPKANSRGYVKGYGQKYGEN